MSPTRARSNSEMLRARMELTTGRLYDSYRELWNCPDIGTRVLDFLILMHQIIRASVPVMRTAKTMASKRADRDPVCRQLVSYLSEHIAEERNHDQWLLEDLASASLPAQVVVQRIPPTTVASLVGAQYYWIQHHHPVALLGYMRLLEGNPPSAKHVSRLQRLSGLPRSVFRTYRLHGELDPHHVGDMDRFLDSLPLKESQGQLIWISGSHTANALAACLEQLEEGMARRAAHRRASSSEPTARRSRNSMADDDEFRKDLLKKLNSEFEPGGQLLSLEEWQQFRSETETVLSAPEMREVIARSQAILRDLYVHMDLKRARRGVDPLSQLRGLDDRIDRRDRQWIDRRDRELDTRLFHQRMLEIFKSLGDVHTAYRLPEPSTSAIAFLPFLINAFYERGEARPRFVVSHVLWKPGDDEYAEFDRGVELVSWNGASMEEAVRRSTDFEEGSNPAHDFALGLQFMTVRWLGASFEPDSPWVMVGYKTAGDETVHECEFRWSVFHLQGGPRLLVSDQARAIIFGTPHPGQQRERAVHVASQVVHAWRKRLFKPDADDEKERRKRMIGAAEQLVNMFTSYVGRDELREFTWRHRRLLRPDGDDVPSLLPFFFTARIHPGALLLEKGGGALNGPELSEREDAIRGKNFGYIGIRAFAISEPERGLFKYEFRRLLNLMPADGVIIDLRDNPGGSTNNAEESLQFVTPKPITPLPFRFLASNLTREIVKLDAFAEYQPSIVAALATGSAFSSGRPITEPPLANAAGQHYFGPVVLLTSATTYSAADIFAAGFEDNAIGPILGVDETTGGGGANCWFYQEEIRPITKDPALPHGINLQIAVRQCARVGEANAGLPIEEFGIPIPQQRRQKLTRLDVIEPRPWRLLLRAAVELAGRPGYDLQTRLTAAPRARELTLTVITSEIDRLHFFVNGRPTAREVGDDQITPFSFPVDGRISLEVHGFAKTVEGHTLVARYVQMLDSEAEWRTRRPNAGVESGPSASAD